MYNIKLQERNIRRRRLHIDLILIEEQVSEDECLADDLAWLDEARENNEEDKDF